MIGADTVQRFRLDINERNRFLVVVAFVAFLFAVGLLAHAVLQSDVTGAESQSAESFKSRSVVSAKGGYELRAPSSWQVSKRGPATTMSSPGGDMVATVGPAPKGNLADSADEIFDSVAKTYSKVVFVGASKQKVDGREAVVFSGKGTNEQDTRLRFVGVTFNDGGRNYSMTAFVREDSDSGRALPRIESILNTFTGTR
ncbi:hypothetical protein BH20ACT23_BH20ACT23_22050 [soil metagenome]